MAVPLAGVGCQNGNDTVVECKFNPMLLAKMVTPLSGDRLQFHFLNQLSSSRLSAVLARATAAGSPTLRLLASPSGICMVTILPIKPSGPEMTDFKTRLTNARVEGFNNKENLVKTICYGYRCFENYRLRLLKACW